MAMQMAATQPPAMMLLLISKHWALPMLLPRQLTPGHNRQKHRRLPTVMRQRRCKVCP